VSESLGVSLAWSLAVLEATSAASETIEPEYFLAALAKLGAAPLDELDTEERLSRSDRKRLREELTLVMEAFRILGVDPEGLYKELCDRFGMSKHPPSPEGGVRRSPRSQALFERAKAAARNMGLRQSNLGHLFLALVEEKDSPVCRLPGEHRPLARDRSDRHATRHAATCIRRLLGRRDAVRSSLDFRS